jgi:hypothetical protein
MCHGGASKEQMGMKTISSKGSVWTLPRMKQEVSLYKVLIHGSSEIFENNLSHYQAQENVALYN